MFILDFTSIHKCPTYLIVALKSLQCMQGQCMQPPIKPRFTRKLILIDDFFPLSQQHVSKSFSFVCS